MGLASYHFTDGDDGSYINYEDCCSDWLLSNGLPAPSKRHFEKVNFDSERRKFEGVISWDPEATLEPGVVMWKYSFTFSSDYQTIESGTGLSVNCDDEVVRTTPLGDNGLKYIRYICCVCGNRPLDPCELSCGHTVCRQCLLTNISKSEDIWKCTICKTKVFLSLTVNATTQTPLDKSQSAKSDLPSSLHEKKLALKLLTNKN